MGARDATFEVVDRSAKHLVIRDVGMWDRQLTITNDAEGVVGRLDKGSMLGRGMRLFVYDSEGDLDEFKLRFERRVGVGGEYFVAVFDGFKHCPAAHHGDLPALLGGGGE